MFTFNIHGQADDLSLLEPLVRHLGHVEIAIDYLNDQQPPAREPHPVVMAADAALHEDKHGARKYTARLKHEVERKRKERQIQKVLTPKVIAAVACPTCAAEVGRPCRNPDKWSTEYGFTGHTHFARRQAYLGE